MSGILKIYPDRKSNVLSPIKYGVEQTYEMNFDNGIEIKLKCTPSLDVWDAIKLEYGSTTSLAVWAINYNAIRASYNIPPLPRDESLSDEPKHIPMDELSTFNCLRNFLKQEDYYCELDGQRMSVAEFKEKIRSTLLTIPFTFIQIEKCPCPRYNCQALTSAKPLVLTTYGEVLDYMMHPKAWQPSYILDRTQFPSVVYPDGCQGHSIELTWEPANYKRLSWNDQEPEVIVNDH